MTEEAEQGVLFRQQAVDIRRASADELSVEQDSDVVVIRAEQAKAIGKFFIEFAERREAERARETINELQESLRRDAG